MARGQSGRIVLEVDPNVKRAVHARLAAEGRTMKDWFLEQADAYLNPRQQVLPLFNVAPAREPLMQVAEPRGVPYSSRKQ